LSEGIVCRRTVNANAKNDRVRCSEFSHISLIGL
jgi:hypothetical protein